MAQQTQNMRFDTDRQVPNSKEIERIVLGAIIQDNRLLDELMEVVTPSDFHDLTHFHIANAAFKAINDGHSFNDIQLLQLCRSESLSMDYFTDITNCWRSKNDVIHAAMKMNELSRLRHLIKMSHQINSQAFDINNDPYQMIEQLMEELTQLQIGIKSSMITSIHDVAVETYMAIEKAMNEDVANRSALPTFSVNINHLTGGWMTSEISMIAARPGEGKTAFMIQSVNELMNRNIPCGIISLEMKKASLMQRIFSNLCEINGYTIRDKKLKPQELELLRNKAMEFINANVYIADDVYIDDRKLRPLIRNMITRHKVRAVFIDYFQLIEKHHQGNEVQGNEYLSRTLQKIAREFDIAIICLTQLSRNGNQRPTLENLRGGGLEQAPAMVLGLFDDSYQKEGEPKSEVDLTAIILKSRYGSTGDVKIHYDKKYQRMGDAIETYSMPSIDTIQRKRGLLVDYTEPKSNDIF